MNNQMTVGGFLNFGLENAKKHFLKFFGLIIVGIVVLGIGGAVFAWLYGALGDAGAAIGGLVSAFLGITVAFGFLKNILNLCRGDGIDFMAFVKAKPMTILNFFILGILMGIAVGIGYCLIIIPGIILTLMLLPAPFLVVDRDMGPIAAIVESIKITSGRKMDIFVGFFVSLLIANIFSLFIITLIFTIPMTLFIYVYPYLHLTGQLDEAKKNLEAEA